MTDPARNRSSAKRMTFTAVRRRAGTRSSKWFSDRSRFANEEAIGSILIGTSLLIPDRLWVDAQALTIAILFKCLPGCGMIESRPLSQVKTIIQQICDWLAAFYTAVLQDRGLNIS
jgi:hypothetical protein